MASAESTIVNLDYGAGSRFTMEVDSSRVLGLFEPPKCIESARDTIRRVLEQPIDFPPLRQAVIPDDRVTIALDADTPHAADIIAEVCNVLQTVGADPANVTILQTPSDDRPDALDPRCELPAEIRDQIQWVVHDPDDKARCGYLASSAGGDRIYLARELLDADCVLTVGRIAFDSVLGYRGTNSVFYPGLSDADARTKALGQGHQELGPDDARPLRQFIDEIAWLLGTQFTIQVVASSGPGIFAVFAGAIDSVFRDGREHLNQHWRLNVPERPEIVIVAVDTDASGHGWNQVAAAIAGARNLVARDGRIVVLTDLDQQPGDGLDLVRRASEPSDALKPLRLEGPPDLVAATSIVNGLDWARVYLRSRLDPDLVEDLFMTPVASDDEVRRLLSGSESCAFIGSAQHVHAGVG